MKRKKGFAVALSLLMLVSGIDVSGLGAVRAAENKEYEITAFDVLDESSSNQVLPVSVSEGDVDVSEDAQSNAPQYLSVVESDGTKKQIIDAGVLQDDGAAENENTIYQGTDWYYDSTTNQLVMEDAAINGIYATDGDLSILLSGTNTVTEYVRSGTNEDKTILLRLIGDNDASLSCGNKLCAIKQDIDIEGVTVKTSKIECDGSLKFENSHVVVESDFMNAISGHEISIIDSYVEAKSTCEYAGSLISSYQKITVSGSQLAVVNTTAASNGNLLSNCEFVDSIITKQWKDTDTDKTVTQTNVYGTATLKEDLTIASGDSIEFASGAGITNLDRLTVEEGATILVDGEVHTHHTDDGAVGTWKDSDVHTKTGACKDCPVEYNGEMEEAHTYNEQGFCTECDAYEPAGLNANNVYEISNAGQLYWFAGLINGTLPGETQNASANAVLTADIVVNENVLKSDGTLNEGTFREWAGIGSVNTPYQGIFDGQNHTISGLYYNRESERYVGLFCYIEWKGKVSNVDIGDSYISGQDTIGGVCGYNGGTITNCHNAGVIIGQDIIGGVCGYNSGTMESCSNTGAVSGTGSIGGVCGYNIEAITDCHNTGSVNGKQQVGGVCGSNYKTITDCHNTGSINGSEFVGGVCGYNYTNYIQATITNCYNTGVVSGTGSYEGGVCGYNMGTIEDCSNTGNVSGTGNNIGGVCGVNVNKTITNCYNTGAVSGEGSYVGGVCGNNNGTIESCSNTGVVSGTDNSIGGVCGLNKADITNCYYDSTVYTGEAVGYDTGTVTAAEGKTTAQYRSGEVAYLLQDEQSEEVWGQTIGTEDYPVLGGQKVYQNQEYDTCNDSGKVTKFYSNEQKDKFAPHTLDKTDAVEYCTKEGIAYTYWECSVCGRLFGDENAGTEIASVPVLEALGHDYALSVETSEDGTESSIVFTCQRETCKEDADGHRETVTVKAPDKAGLTYDGTAKEAAVTVSSQDVPESIPAIVYTGDGLSEEGSPVNAGTYTASITIGSGEAAVTASVTYEIAQAAPEIGEVTADNLKDTLDVSQVVLSRTDTTFAGTLQLEADTKLQYGTNDYTYTFTPADSNYKTTEGTVSITINDTIAPTASYKLGTDGWKKFVNTITFGRFCKDYQTVEIICSDKAADGETDGSGIAKKQYYVSNQVIDYAQTEITDEMWKDYSQTIHLDAEGTWLIYVRVADRAGNEVILNSEGVVIYAESTVSPAETEYAYKEGKDRTFDVTFNGNTFNRLTDETGNDLAADSYTLDGDGALTLKAAYLDTLKLGAYTYKLYMNPQGVTTDQVELVYTFTVTVKQAELTVTGAAAESRPYDGTASVKLSSVTISGVRDGEEASVAATGLQGTLSSVNAGSYTEVILPQLILTGADKANYRLVQPESAVKLSDTVKISKLDAQITLGAAGYDKTYGDAAFSLNATKNNPEEEISYTVTSGADIISVENGTAAIQKAGKAEIILSLAESTNFNAAEDKVITVNVAKKTGYKVDTVNRSYLYLRENEESIDLAALLPKDCGSVTYGSPVVSGDVTYSKAPAADGNGVLSYTVAKGTSETIGKKGTILITAVTDNYADITITVQTAMIDRIPVQVKSGTGVTLKDSVITYGEPLSKMTFNDVVFVAADTDTDGEAVQGTLSWKNPDNKPDAGTASAVWIFTPDREEYAALEGEISITVKKAEPQVTELPAVEERAYHPSGVLLDSDLTGGAVKGTDKAVLAGTWSWQSAGIVPAADNTGYIAVFTPEDAANYEQITRTITVKVTKVTPVITKKPSAAELTYGDSLEKAVITGGAVAYSASDAAAVTGAFAWKDASVKPVVADSNSKAFTVIFTPADGINYESVETEITITVNKAAATPNMPGNTMNVAYGTKKVSEITLPESWVWQETDRDTALEVGVTTKATALYTGADKGNYETESVVINITRSLCEHKNTELKNTKGASCENTGYTGDTYCKDCGVKLTDGAVTAALGHNYTGAVTKQPTTDSTGICTYTCSRCSSQYEETIPKLPEEEEEEEHSHSYTDTITRQATCMEAGIRTWRCACGDSYTEKLPAPGHSYTSRITKNPTTKAEGVMTYTCSRCGYSYTQSIQKLSVKGSTGNGSTGSGEPYIREDSSNSGWESITEQVEAAKTGGTITVEMNKTTTVPAELFEQLKGKDLAVVFDMDNGIRWTVNGKDVTEIKGDIDFGVTTGTKAGKTIPVTVINRITGEHESMNLTLAYEGEFGFTATLTVNLKEENAGCYANLFYYNPDSSNLEFVCAGQIGKTGDVALTFTHASDYTIVIADAVMDKENTDSTGNTENTDNTGNTGNTGNAGDTGNQGSESSGQTAGSSTVQEGGDSAGVSLWLILAGIALIVIAGVGAAVIKRKEHNAQK